MVRDGKKSNLDTGRKPREDLAIGKTVYCGKGGRHEYSQFFSESGGSRVYSLLRLRHSPNPKTDFAFVRRGGATQTA